MNETNISRDRINELTSEQIALVPYDKCWQKVFEQEKEFLLSLFPPEIIKRIEHYGSTAIPDILAKPIIDILIEVGSLDETKKIIMPELVSRGYEYIWRPSFGDDIPPFYAWFIKRDASGQRAHHLHFVERDFPQWNGVIFRDYLLAHPGEAQAYSRMKQELAQQFPNDRAAYTKGKTVFIEHILNLAKNETRD
jgi:GrpB-like predicted nucleotidyltransferase (UPF0157 family)